VERSGERGCTGTAPPPPPPSGDSCTHTLGGRYADQGCSAGYQCCDGNWRTRGSCGSCSCVETTGERGCGAGSTPPPGGGSTYSLPFDCGYSARCSNGNHTSLHTEKDAYAYDFAVPAGTVVRAMRGGTVLRVRNVSFPGDPCYSGGGSACANLANTVEIRHDDGTVGLYMHLHRGTASVGARVAQGVRLGFSGNSGWSTGAHLHVQVQQNCGIWWCQSIPLTFGEDRTISDGTVVTSAKGH
jgi:murein DD-endopeptidase MepM/ murein hydrolase activator NlpD